MLLCVVFACATGVVSAATSVLLSSYLQPNDDTDRYSYLLNAKSNKCARICNETEAPKICYYQWTIENHVTLSDACGSCPSNVTACSNARFIPADGYERSILSTNRKLPGPSIEVMTPENSSCSTGSTGLCVTQLVNSDPVPWDILGQLPDVNCLLQFGFETFYSRSFFIGYDRYFASLFLELLSSTVNNISLVAPPSPLLSRRADVQDDILCPTEADGLPHCPAGNSYCTCVYIIKIKLGALVQIILSDHNKSPKSGINHPFHLHGQTFYVMDMGQYADGQTAQELLNFLNSNVKIMSPASVLKDTIVVPSGGYAVIKFRANNPGYWFFHCHFLYHLVTGMSVVLQVGETSDYPPVPDGFPKCGNFTPQVVTN